MTEEQITNRYVRGWISLAEYRAELVKFYDREDAREAAERFLAAQNAQFAAACQVRDNGRCEGCGQ